MTRPPSAPPRVLVAIPDSAGARGATIHDMVQHVFRARIWEHSSTDPGSWHFLTLPAGLSDDITLEAGPRKGFGSIRVEVSIGVTTWHTSLFPDSATGSYLLPVKKQVRRAEGLLVGATCEVTLEVASPDPV